MIAGTRGDSIRRIWMDFTARRYDTFSETFEIKYMNDAGRIIPLDLTGCEAQMHIKKVKGDGAPILVMDVSLSDTEVTISKNHLEMDLTKGRYWHDIEIKDADGDHITWIEGRFIVIEHVTHYLDTIEEFFDPIIQSVLSILTVPKWIFTTLFKQEIAYFESLWYYFINKTAFQQTILFKSIVIAFFKANITFANKILFQDSTKIKYKTIFMQRLAVVTRITQVYGAIFSNKVEFLTSES